MQAGNKKRGNHVKRKRISGESLTILFFKFGQFGIASLILFEFLKVGFSCQFIVIFICHYPLFYLKNVKLVICYK